MLRGRAARRAGRRRRRRAARRGGAPSTRSSASPALAGAGARAGRGPDVLLEAAGADRGPGRGGLGAARGSRARSASGARDVIEVDRRADEDREGLDLRHHRPRARCGMKATTTFKVEELEDLREIKLQLPGLGLLLALAADRGPGRRPSPRSSSGSSPTSRSRCAGRMAGSAAHEELSPARTARSASTACGAAAPASAPTAHRIGPWPATAEELDPDRSWRTSGSTSSAAST